MEDYCTCKRGSKGRCICSSMSSDRFWCSICKKNLVPETEEEKKKRKKFLRDCHSVDDAIVKSLSSPQEWLEYKKKKVAV